METFEEVIEAYDREGFFFIQVGAHDGVTDDDLRPMILGRGWQGLLIEPLPDVFERLRENYREDEDRLAFLNAAISEKGGPLEFWRHGRLPQCSGAQLLTKLQRRASRRGEIEKVVVKSWTWGAVFHRYLVEVDQIDLLQVDVEGLDHRIIQWYFRSGLRAPRVIRYESKHLSHDDELELLVALRWLGYWSFEEGPDTVCYLPK